jgi:hypothetical protein
MGLCLERTFGALFSTFCFANYFGKFNSFWIHFNQGNLWGFHFNEEVLQGLGLCNNPTNANNKGKKWFWFACMVHKWSMRTPNIWCDATSIGFL